MKLVEVVLKVLMVVRVKTLKLKPKITE